jgi:hypothetical protein
MHNILVVGFVDDTRLPSSKKQSDAMDFLEVGVRMMRFVGIDLKRCKRQTENIVRNPVIIIKCLD